MAKRPLLLQPSDATRYFKAARAAGYPRARVIAHPDGRIEVVGEDSADISTEAVSSPFEEWKARNAR